MVFKLGEIMQRVEPKLHAHLEQNQLELIQFSFRYFALQSTLPTCACIL